MMQSSHRWVYCVLSVFLLLSACAPVMVEVEPTATPPLAIPHITVATFTPVPVTERSAEPAMSALPAEAEVAAEGTSVQVEAPASPNAPVDVLPFTYHTVAPGDTILGLALKYGVPIAVVQLQNDLGNSIMLRVGQVLEIPPAVGWEGASPFWAVYEVQAGDVLSAIAANFGFDVTTLQNVS